jgi:PASTA domain
MNSTSSH